MLDWCAYRWMFLSPIRSSWRSQSVLLLPSPASAFRNEACKDMHAFILTWARAGGECKECVSEADPLSPFPVCDISMFLQLIETNHSISTSDFRPVGGSATFLLLCPSLNYLTDPVKEFFLQSLFFLNALPAYTKSPKRRIKEPPWDHSTVSVSATQPR